MNSPVPRTQVYFVLGPYLKSNSLFKNNKVEKEEKSPVLRCYFTLILCISNE